jgi:hypothetical protein
LSQRVRAPITGRRPSHLVRLPLSAGCTISRGWPAGGFVNGSEEITCINEFIARGVPTSEQFVVIDNARKRRLEQAVNRDPESRDELIEDIEGNVRYTALDVGNGLPCDAGSLGERGL